MPGRYVMLEDRAVITLKGEDRADYLQGLISNDIRKCTANHAIWTAFLTPQGKFLHEFFVGQAGDCFWLDCEASRLMDLGQRLRRFQLRSNIELDIGRDLKVFAAFDVDPAEFGLSGEPGEASAFADGLAFTDPRLPSLGIRIIATETAAREALSHMGMTVMEAGDYHSRRVALGIPDGSRDMEPEKAILLENGFDELGGVDWSKGCYMGQELTARTKYRGLVKKRLLPVISVNGEALGAETAILAGDKEIGEMRSAAGARGLALIRLDRWHDAMAHGRSLTLGGMAVVVDVPAWVNLAANTKSAAG